jgi:hypothetical protein
LETQVKSPREIFHQSQHLNVPLFQRRYVWDQDEQWVPLWDDVRRVAVLRAGGQTSADHFLGAIVLQSQAHEVGGVQQWSVIDGQQRLTTLQLLMDAAAAQLEDRGETKLANRLHKLTRNDEDDVAGPEDVLKVRHSNGDREIYIEVMDAPAPVDHAALTDPSAKLVRAHAYFSREVQAWLDLDPIPDGATRAEVLVDVLAAGLQLVAITLRADEDSQEIFETLNARGTPLTSADLIKNLVFQRLAAEGMDGGSAYQKYWSLFESSFWEQEISVGRFFMPRSAVFLGQWLISRTGEDIGGRAIFTRFKHFVDHEFHGDTMALLELLHAQAVTYESWTREAHGKNPNIDRVPLFVYRMDAADLEVAKPLLLWLHEPDHPTPEEEVRTAVDAVESWLIRRMIMRLPTSDLGRVVANLIESYRGTPVVGLGGRIRDQLARASTISTYRPGDDDVRAAVAELPAYSSYKRARLRMLLEAAEDARRGYTGPGPALTGSRIARKAMHIEHLLPRSWKTHWPVSDLAEEVERDKRVHRLGNLTLLTKSLNSTVSNGPWVGPNGKHQALQKHDVCLLTRDVWLDHPQSWTEADIDARTANLVAQWLRTWPVPPGHQGHIEQAVPVDTTITLQQLVAAGVLPAGTTLVPRTGGDISAVITDQGRLEMNGVAYDSPSGAVRAIVGHAVNGWYYWRLADGRRLKDLRDDYLRSTISD